jgi:hypothetical protein
MARSSILGGDLAPKQASGNDTDALGPSDTSDSGSDIQGEPELEGNYDREGRLGAGHTDRGSDSDGAGTGERGSALPDEFVEEGLDISPDHIEAIGPSVGADENDVSAEAVRGGVGDLAEESDDDSDEEDEDEDEED